MVTAQGDLVSRRHDSGSARLKTFMMLRTERRLRSVTVATAELHAPSPSVAEIQLHVLHSGRAVHAQKHLRVWSAQRPAGCDISQRAQQGGLEPAAGERGAVN